MRPNTAQQLTIAPKRAIAAERQSRWAEMRMTIVLSIALGMIWHTLALGVSGQSATKDWSWGLLAGAAAGVAAGQFTLWSRKRLHGRESFAHVAATYYLAILVYWFSGGMIETLLGIGRGDWEPFFVAYISVLPWVLGYCTLLGVVLLPLCWVSRDLLWTCHVRIRPNKT